MRRPITYVVDLTKIDGEGYFPCPRCGVIISPEDETETTYIILEVKMMEDKKVQESDQQLKELVIRCNECGGIIHITGFTSLVDYEDGKVDSHPCIYEKAERSRS